MNKITFQNQGKTFVRISKAKARKMYNKGLTIALCPVKQTQSALYARRFS